MQTAEHQICNSDFLLWLKDARIKANKSASSFTCTGGFSHFVRRITAEPTLGLGIKLAEAAKEVIAVEIDKALIPILQETLKDYDNITLINEDILKVDIAALVEEKNAGGFSHFVRRITAEPTLGLGIKQFGGTFATIYGSA